MDCNVREFSLSSPQADAEAFSAVWNIACSKTFGFAPFSAETFLKRISGDRRFRQERLLLADVTGEIVGFLHYDVVRERHYQPAAVICAVAVCPAHRGKGIASALMRTALRRIADLGLPLCEGGGGWPYSPYYATCIDGSERSGVHLEDEASLRLYQRFRFYRAQPSLIMALNLKEKKAPPVPLPPGLQICTTARCSDATWLDHVFRGWSLTNQALCDYRNACGSRCIYGKMNGQSLHSGYQRYALFGVHTPATQRRQGFGYMNISHLLEQLKDRGGDSVELHVHADNTPAVNLYRRLGFEAIGETTSFRLSPSWKRP